MALLTRAQWRVTLEIPKLMETERKALGELLAQGRGETQVATRKIQEALRTQS